MSTPTDELPERFWMTRDRIGGDLADAVEIWGSRPIRRVYEDGDVQWFTSELSALDGTRGVLDEWTIAEAKRRYAGAPDTDLECVVVGREP